MPYHTLTDLTTKLTTASVVQLTDDRNTGTIDTAVTDDAARSAAGLIDGMLRARYSLPLASSPDILREASLSLVIFDLYRRRMGVNEVPKAVREERDGAMSILGLIRDGKISLFEEDRSSTFLSNRTGKDKAFSDEVLESM
jgi:phage gp36-like protein